MSDFSSCSLVIGRFQPFHLGHLDVIRKCATESEQLIVGIGSAQYSHLVQNPFTAGERHMMIRDALYEQGIENYSIVPIEDLNRYSSWVAHVKAMCPAFSTVYTNNPFTSRLFTEANFKTKQTPLYNRNIYSGTEVRRRMIADEDWRSLVPPAVQKVIDAIDGVGRVKQINTTGQSI